MTNSSFLLDAKQWHTLAKYQDELNSLILGPDWKTKSNKQWSFYRRILVTAGKAICVWEEQQQETSPALDQYRIKLVDIFGHALSDSMRSFAQERDPKDLYTEYSKYMEEKAVSPSFKLVSDVDVLTPLDTLDMVLASALDTGRANVANALLALQSVDVQGDRLVSMCLAVNALHKFRRSTPDYRYSWGDRPDTEYLLGFLEVTDKPYPVDIEYFYKVMYSIAGDHHVQ